MTGKADSLRIKLQGGHHSPRVSKNGDISPKTQGVSPRIKKLDMNALPKERSADPTTPRSAKKRDDIQTFDAQVKKIENTAESVYSNPWLNKEIQLHENELQQREKIFDECFKAEKKYDTKTFKLELQGKIVSSYMSEETRDVLKKIVTKIEYPLSGNKNLYVGAYFTLESRLFLEFNQENCMKILYTNGLETCLPTLKFAKCPFLFHSDILRIEFKKQCDELNNSKDLLKEDVKRQDDSLNNSEEKVKENKKKPLEEKTNAELNEPESINLTQKHEQTENSLDLSQVKIIKKIPAHITYRPYSPRKERLDTPPAERLNSLAKKASIQFAEQTMAKEPSRIHRFRPYVCHQELNDRYFLVVSAIFMREKIRPNGVVSLPNGTSVCIDRLPLTTLKSVYVLNDQTLTLRINNFYTMNPASYRIL